MLMLHRSRTDDIVDRPNDDRRVEISLMIYIINCTIYYYLFIMSSVSDCDSRAVREQEVRVVNPA